MKTKNIIQRLCLFLFALMLALPAVATNYNREGYETFRSRELGKHQTVTTLRKGPVKVWFSHCKTSGGTGSDAIFELQKGTRIQIEVDEGYAIRWVILRDTEGGKRYSDPEGIKRISSVTPGYKYYFERNAISNSHISGGNQNQLNDDDNNIVVYNYDAPEKIVYMWSHNNSKWDQFKVRDIIVGYVRAPKVRFERDRYDMYYTSIPSSFFKPVLNYDTHNVNAEFKVDNNDIATVTSGGFLKFKRPGTVVFTATCSASENCAKAQCSTTVTTKRDGVTFTSVGLPDVLFSNTPHNLRDYLNNSKTKSGENFDYNDESFSVTSSNNAVLRYDMPYLKFSGTAGEATITFTQKETNFYEATTFSHTIIVARRDQNGTILIKDANEWKVFCKLVNEKGRTNLNAKLEADVNLGTDIAMLGYGKRYSGTFDGNGHTLKINWNSGDRKWIAPFQTVDGATIKNLRTEGVINSSTYFLSGLIYEAFGTTTISGCVSAVNITSSYNEGGCNVAGIIECVRKDAKVTITDCVVKGKFHATTENGRRGISGFVYNQYGSCTFTNCLYAGENNSSSGYTFCTNSFSGTTITNCYYLNTCGTAQGTKITEEQLKSGEVAYKLQKGKGSQVWGQTLKTHGEPQLITFTKGAEKVYQVSFTYNSQVKATRYANSGKTIYGSMPTFTAKDLLGSSYNEHHYYSGIAFEDGFNGSTTVTSDKQVRINLTEKDCYEIASADNWKEFCNIVNNSGQNAVDAKLTQDVNLGSDIWQVGNHYAGTFDGQGHTLKINWNDTSGWLAPFKTVDGATIKNLRTEGEIKSSLNFLSGLVREAYGNTTISGCVSAVNITSSYNDGGCDAAGIIECVRDNAKVTITDCVVKGKFTATTEKGRRYMSGFVCNQYGTCTLTNCLYAGENNCSRGYTFCTNSFSSTTITNCYYLNTCGTAQGTQVTEEQLKSGEVTKKLQNNRTDKCYWAQQLGEMPDFYNAADKSKANYVYYDAAKKGWVCDDFRLTDGQPLPIGLDFTAATVTYERNFNGAQKATLCLPYDLYAQGFKAYTLSGGNKNEVHFKEVDDKLTAYTPYYITANGMPQLGGRNIEVKAYKADKMTTPAAGYKFTGTVAGVSNATAAADNAYILQDDGKFHKVTTTNSAATIPAYRAYIICPPQASGAKQLSVVLDGETTGIGSTTNEATDGKNGPVYDLQGRRVADRLDDARHRLPAGVYIVGGRKVVVK
ncbi:peptidase M26 [Segatella buccae]|uniref:peptidase M26 n=1 Tax=Segatella buccae TaxID=28126 RepID=UPI00248DF29C|nr:peptidase M26 [Segatella buccae]